MCKIILKISFLITILKFSQKLPVILYLKMNDLLRTLLFHSLKLRICYNPLDAHKKLKIKSVAYSSQGSHTGQLDFCN